MRTIVFGALISLVSYTTSNAQNCALLPQYQGLENVTPSTPLLSNTITGADSYVFEIVTAAGYFVEEITSTDNAVTLAESGLNPGLLREITVRVKTISTGTVSDYGASVSFSTEGLPLVPCTDISALEEAVYPGSDYDDFNEWRNEKIRRKLDYVETYRGGGGCQTSYRIPVVFHIVHDPAFPVTNVPDSYILEQLAIINNEFNGPNPNTLGGNACLEFCLAQNTPNGEDWLTDFNSNTPGITRWGDDVATHHGDGGTVAQQELVDVVMFPRNRYLNVWICSDVVDGPSLIVGYATLPGSMGTLDGVVMEYQTVTDYGGIFEYDEGFTLVHEIGHYLGLYHTFKGGTTCISAYPECEDQGDKCCDTPPTSAPNISGCIDLTPQSCGVVEQLENYMDYTFEFCKSTFTEDQISRMHASLLSFRSELIDPANHNITGIAGPNGCTDVILTAAFDINATQLCTNTTPCVLSGSASFDTWTFAFTGGALQAVSGNGTVPNAIVLFPTPGTWTVSLTVSSNGESTTSAPQTVYVSDCSPMLTEQAQWRFGLNCGLDFTSGLPVAVDMEINAHEASATMAVGGIGAHLFSSTHNGILHPVTNTIMDPPFWGGDNWSSAQGALILHDQTDPNKYFVFSSRQTGPPGQGSPLHYSVIDVTTNTLVLGQADVPIGPNEPETTEHLSAVPHCNGTDHWIVTHGADEQTRNKLISYRFSDGAIVERVLSPAYSVDLPGPNGVSSHLGLIKFNKEGTLAAITTIGQDCRLHSFDRATGVFEFVVTLPNAFSGYGASFSPSGDFLFTQTVEGFTQFEDGFYQYDLRNLDLCNPVVPARFHPLEQGISPGSLQLGPDGKIYLSEYNETFISVINYPEVWSNVPNSIGFNYLGVQLRGASGHPFARCQGGLPNVIDANPEALNDFEWCSIDCQNVTFEIRGCGNVIEWDIDCDGSVNGQGNDLTYTFSTPGSHCISATIDGQVVTHTIDISIPPAPIIQPGIVCMNVPVNYIATNTNGFNHQWAVSGSGTSFSPLDAETIEVTWNGPGEISLIVSDPVTGCTNTSSLLVAPLEYEADAGPDLTICQGVTVALSAQNGPINCAWYPSTFLDNPATCAPNLLATAPGIYTYTLNAVDGNGCFDTDDVLVTVLSAPEVTSITPNSACVGVSTSFSVVPQSGMDYLWTTDANGAITGANDQSNCQITWSASGTVSLTITDQVTGCTITNSQQVNSTACLGCANISNTVIAPGALASVVGTFLSGTVDIQGQFIVDDEVTFANATVYMEPGAEIIVQPGQELYIDNSSFTACNGEMWKSITANSGSTVQIRGSFMDDAESTIRALDGSTVWIDNTQFHNNRVAIGIPANGLWTSNVSCWVANSTFYSAGAMAQPYPGQTTVVGSKGFAAVDVNNTSFDLSGGNNLIHSLSNGIVGHRSNINVSGCQMLHIQPDAAYTFPGNGSGIYARGVHGFFTLKQTGYGINDMPSFTDCRWGVYTSFMNVYSATNKMVDVGTAYHVERSNNRIIEVLDNKLDTRYDGIQLYMNDGCDHMWIARNDITFATNPPAGQFVKGYIAIRVNEANAHNNSSIIQENTIWYRPNVSTAYAGILLNAASEYYVFDNTLRMHNNSNNYAGIYMTSCQRPLISCNAVLGSNTNYNVNDGQSAIRNNLGDNVSIVCNDVDGTTNGILFSGPTLNTDLRGNNIRRHKWGLHIGSATVIPDQNLKGNLWYNTPEPGGYHARSENQNAADFPFTYSPEMVLGGNTEPAQQHPFNWFMPVLGQNYHCDDGTADYCSAVVRSQCDDCKTELDEKVANDDLENDPYTEETKQMLESDLFKKLDNEPSMMQNDQDLADFFAAMQNSNVAQFKQINDDYLAMFDLDVSITNYLAANKVQLELLMGDLKTALSDLGDPNLSAAERQAIMATANGIQLSMRNLTNLNTQALELAATSKALNAESVKAANSAIGTTELIETNNKQVNEIYLSTVAKEIDTFTGLEEVTLFVIANQCPMVGGNAVYRARSLYALIDDDQEYDDAALCLQQGIIYKSMSVAEASGISILPNPASDDAMLVYTLAEGINGNLYIYDAMGKEVQRFGLSADHQRFNFSTEKLKAGVYHYVVRTNTGILGEGKLMIVR